MTARGPRRGRLARLAALGLSPLALAAPALLAIGCEGGGAPSGPPPAAEGAAPAAAVARHAAGDEPLVTLSAEAIRQAGIVTEIVRRSPMAITLSVPARLSPTPETPEEVEARLAYQAADARFQQASAGVERLRKLSAENVVSSKSLQAAEADFAQARVERARAETALRNLGINAAREGSFPAADLWALADIYDAQVPHVKPGAVTWIHVESFPGEAFEGRVASLASSLKPLTRTLTVRIAVKDPRHRLRPQEPATAEIQVDARPALSVPAPSLLYEGSERVVFVRRDGATFEKVRVRVGAQQAGRNEILEGLTEGEEVVTRGAQILLGESFRTRIPQGDGADSEAD
ncbi:MAG: hypothetical protein DMF50_05725 [Acidobacteria bacterium]|nr:MAG: hypothetical protein DMF50_05725 [Acidobacteriota bacterium]